MPPHPQVEVHDVESPVEDQECGSGYNLQTFVIIHCTSVFMAVRWQHLDPDKIGGGSDGR